MQVTEKEKRDAGRLARKGAEVLKDRKWVKGDLGDTNNGVCAVGAINLAFCGNAKPKRLTPMVMLVDKLFGTWSGSANLMYYNDYKAETKEDVVQMLEKFADTFDPQGGK